MAAVSDRIVTSPTTNPERDVVERLPLDAADILLELRSELEAAHDVARGAVGRVDDARKNWISEKDRLAALEAAARDGRLVRVTPIRADEGHSGGRRIEFDEQRLEAGMKNVVKARAELDRRAAEYQRLGDRAQTFGVLHSRIETWLGAIPHDVAIVMHDGAIKVPKGADALAHIRQQLESLKAEADDARAAPRPASEIKEGVDRWLDRLARKGRPDIKALFEGVDAVELPTERKMFHAVSTDGSTGTAVGSIVDAGALIAWLMRDQFAERLGTMIDAEAEDELALTNEERAGRLDDLARRTLEAGRVEAELLHAAREAGAPVLPRPDHDVRAYLRLSSNLPAPRE